MIDFKCPRCHDDLSAKDGDAGQATECPGCKSLIRVPEFLEDDDDDHEEVVFKSEEEAIDAVDADEEEYTDDEEEEEEEEAPAPPIARKRRRPPPTKKNSQAVLIVCVSIGVILCGFIAYFATTAIQNSMRRKREAMASIAIRTITTANIQYEKQHERYATLSELSATEPKFIKDEIGDGEVSGYVIELTLSEDGRSYQVTAEPDSGSGEHYFVDESGNIRVEKGKPATVESPLIGSE